MPISTFLLVLLLAFSSLQVKYASADSLEANSDFSLVNTNDSIETLGMEDNFCKGIFNGNNGDSYVTIQTNTDSPNRSLQWAFNIRPYAYDKYNPEVKVQMTNAYVNGKRANNPYSPHYEAPSYSFHGSMKTYQIQGLNYSLKSGDTVSFNWSAFNTSNTNNVTTLYLECVVE